MRFKDRVLSNKIIVEPHPTKPEIRIKYKQWDCDTGDPIPDYIEDTTIKSIQHTIDNFQAEIDSLVARKQDWEDKLAEAKKIKPVNPQPITVP